MWSIKQLEEIRDDCLADIIAVFPDMEGQLTKQRIEINHRTINTLARFSMNYIEISVYLLSSSTTKIFLQTLIMKGVIKGQLRLQEYDLAFEQIVAILQKNNPDKYDFEEYKDFTKHNVWKCRIKFQGISTLFVARNVEKFFGLKKFARRLFHHKSIFVQNAKSV